MSDRRQHSETARQLLHVSMGAFALLLRWLHWGYAVGLAVAAVLFNAFLLPRFAARLYRPGDRDRGVHGILYYPIAVLALLLLFPSDLAVVAAAWGILAAGDGMATLVGRAVGGPRWPWNRDKTVAGTAALWLAGSAAGAGLFWWCRTAAPEPRSLIFLICAPIAAAALAAAVETMDVRLDDNLSVGLTAGAALWLLTLVSPGAIGANLPVLTSRLLVAVVVNVCVAWGGRAARTVSTSGAVTGAIIGTVIFTALGWAGWGLLLLTFLAAAITSKLGLKRKTLLGIAEDRGGRRGPGNAIANTGVAAIAAALAVSTLHPERAAWAFAAALAAGGSDTIASEIGKAWGRTTWLLTSFKRVPPGTSGAMSMEGTAAGIVGALALGAIAIAFGIVPYAALPPIVIAATAGALVESALGATLEGPGILNNDMLNFINTTVAALLAVAFCVRLT
ncbi:MAG TPA: DUF92 domain-containing protein [Vicinamibacterales bacterium]|jgi:uncharacterized protein (TIGR00297 family)|nr:DUF92 domain-containing protein [Vicinamibacterales bacterium]